ncbi:MAG: hypothetical protein ACUVRH_06795 [Candidatus Bipolaricaulia bacterium]
MVDPNTRTYLAQTALKVVGELTETKADKLKKRVIKLLTESPEERLTKSTLEVRCGGYGHGEEFHDAIEALARHGYIKLLAKE